jgi:hypothetical protein
MKRNRYSILFFALIMSLVLTGCGVSEEKQKAIDNFNTEVSRIQEQLIERDSVVKSAEDLVLTGKLALDSTLLPILETAISGAKAISFEIPKLPSNVEEIDNAVASLKAINNADLIKAVSDALKNIENSIKQYEQVSAPNDSFIIERLTGISEIKEIASVTEDNDPNGNLGKAGSYTAQVFFTTDLVDQSEVSGNTAIDKGTSGGGSIEVYATEEDAKKRNEYLATFDGTFLASGSHTVIGTVVVRTSNLLKASQQKELESKIIEALTKLP